MPCPPPRHRSVPESAQHWQFLALQPNVFTKMPFVPSQMSFGCPPPECHHVETHECIGKQADAPSQFLKRPLVSMSLQTRNLLPGTAAQMSFQLLYAAHFN